MGRDARLVLLAKTARTFCYGFLGVLLPVYLTQLGLDATELGVAVTLTLLASTAMTFAIRWPDDDRTIADRDRSYPDFDPIRDAVR